MLPSKCLHCNVQKHFIYIFYTYVYAENIYKLSQETKFDWKCFLNIDKIDDGYAGNGFQTFVMKCLINSIHKTFKQHLLTMFYNCLL